MISDYFSQLANQLHQYHLPVDPPYLHGLLTGFATTPEGDLEKLCLEIAGGHPFPDPLREELIDTVDILSEDLSLNDFQARFQAEHGDEPERWIKGYLRSVEIHEAQWHEENEYYPKAASALVVLHSLVDEQVREELRITRPGDQELREQPALVTDLALTIYQCFHGDLDDEACAYDDQFDLPADEPLPLPRYPEEQLATMDEQSLLALVTADEDRLPLEVVHAAAGRAEAMVPLLHRHLMTDAHWSTSGSSGDWWALLHALHILGLIPGEASASALLDGFRRTTFDSNNNLADWVSGYWAALCRNKTEYTTGPMMQIAEDRGLEWYPRSHAVQCVLASAGEGNSTRLEEAIDWLAALCADESHDPEFRVIAAHSLLDHPRERHRRMLEDLVDLQDPHSWFGNSFDRDDIDRSFARGGKPDWKRFENPWRFYDPEEIRHRQLRWLKEASMQEAQPYGLEDWEPIETYRREQPKIGRNDPCPCGSGKKYKKCCLNKLH
jgi:hypothetical protein